MSKDTIKPHSNEAEQATLACLMIEDNSFDEVVGIITSSDFYNKSNALIFSTIQDLYSRDSVYDISTVSAALSAAGLLVPAGGISYLADLTTILPNAANLARYARQVKNQSKLRQLSETAAEIAQVAQDHSRDIGRDPLDALNIAGQLILDISNGAANKDPTMMEQLLVEAYTKMEERCELGGGLVGLSSGFARLDDMTSGLQDGSLIVIAGRPAMGKTSFAMNIAQHVAHCGFTVAVFSLEMPATQLVQRVISSEAGVAGYRVQRGLLDSDDWQQIVEMGDRMSKMKILIDDTSAISVVEITAKCRRMKSNKKHGLDLVIVDYLQLMGDKSIQSREQQISTISRSLKAMAKDLSVPVIALSQLNRALENRANKRPALSDLRESGAIEQDADQVMFIYRDEVYDSASKDKGVAEIIIAKNRSGETGVIKLGFRNAYTQFHNLNDSDQGNSESKPWYKH